MEKYSLQVSALRSYIHHDIIPRLNNLKGSAPGVDDFLLLADVGQLILISRSVATYLWEAITLTDSDGKLNNLLSLFKPTNLQMKIYKLFKKTNQKGNERSMLILACMLLNISPGDQTSHVDSCFITEMNSNPRTSPLSLITELAAGPLKKIIDAYLSEPVDQVEPICTALKAALQHMNSRSLSDRQIYLRSVLTCQGDAPSTQCVIGICMYGSVLIFISWIVGVFAYHSILNPYLSDLDAFFATIGISLLQTALVLCSSLAIVGCILSILAFDTKRKTLLSNLVIDARQQLLSDHDIPDLETKAIINILASTAPKKSTKYIKDVKKNCCRRLFTKPKRARSPLTEPLLPLYRRSNTADYRDPFSFPRQVGTQGVTIVINPIADGTPILEDSEFSLMAL